MIQLLTDFLCGEPGSLCALDLGLGALGNRELKSELNLIIKPYIKELNKYTAGFTV